MPTSPIQRLRKKLPETVCFRLPDSYMQRLVEQAQSRQCSQNELARQLVIDYLEDNFREQIENRLGEVGTEVTLLRGDMALLAEALLVTVNREGLSTHEARAWVEQRLRQAARKDV